MRIPKCVRDRPWPEPAPAAGQSDFSVSLSWPAADGERLLVGTFLVNRRKHPQGPDFRVICWKKQNRVRILYRDRSGGALEAIDQALRPLHTWASVCYPELSGKDERALCRWLGVRESRNHGLPEWNAWTEDAAEAERQARRDARGELGDEDVSLCPEELPEGLLDYIRRTVLPEDRVLLYKPGNIRGTCFQCRNRVRAEPGQRFRQNELCQCPRCGAEVAAVLEGGQSFSADYVEDVAALQPGTDGETVFVRQWHLLRDPTAQWDRLETRLEEVARYAVRGNRAAKWQHEAKEADCMRAWRFRLESWTRVRTVSQVYDGTYYFFAPENWRELLAGTSLRYCDLDGYLTAATERRKNPIRFLLDWARYPAVEKLWKAGYRQLVHEKIQGISKQDRKAVRWSRSTIPEAVGVTLGDLKLLPAIEWTASRLSRLTEARQLVREGLLREGELEDVLGACFDLGAIRPALAHASFHRVARYLERRNGWTYRDYLAECGALGLDLSDRAVLFPKDLDAAHARTISQVRYKADKDREKQFAGQVRKLERLSWAQDGLMIRPAQNEKELIAEGAYLHHCVGGYAERMANGKTAIFLIRRAEDPDTPFYTLEWQGGRVVQCRTKQNKSYEQDPEVSAFVQAWAERVKKARGDAA